MLAMTALFADAPVFPTSLGELPGGPPPLTRSSLYSALRHSALYMAEAKRLGDGAARPVSAAAVPA
jgi:hypothetical protein